MKSYYTVHELKLYDRIPYNVLIKSNWKKTKYINYISNNFYTESENPDSNAIIIFEKSIVDEYTYVCIKLGDEMRK